MKFKCIQTFSPEYLKKCRAMTAEGILQFLDDFTQLHAASIPKNPRPTNLDAVNSNLYQKPK